MNRVDRFIQFDFDRLREAAAVTILVFLLAKTAFSLATNLIIYPRMWLSPVANATSGLIQPTLVVNLVQMLLIVLGVIIVIGRLRASDIGLVKSRFLSGAVATLALYVLVQVAGLVRTVAAEGALSLNAMWSEVGVATLAGLLLAQLLGNALFEETAFRGFLLPQAFIRLGRGRLISRPQVRFTLALLASQGVFALMHIPNRLYQGIEVSALPMMLFTLLGIGVLYSLVYLRTGNLFIAVGLHSLVNTPTSLFASDSFSRNLFLLLGLLLIAIGPYVSRALATICSRSQTRLQQSNPGT